MSDAPNRLSAPDGGLRFPLGSTPRPTTTTTPRPMPRLQNDAAGRLLRSWFEAAQEVSQIADRLHAHVANLTEPIPTDDELNELTQIHESLQVAYTLYTGFRSAGWAVLRVTGGELEQIERDLLRGL